ncbi:class I SAM-dependent methyltransferase [Haloferacaceae archaeon DSL9]
MERRHPGRAADATATTRGRLRATDEYRLEIGITTINPKSDTIAFVPPDEAPTVADAHDKLAKTYKAQEEDPYRADFEFPATTELIPHAEGKRVLDAGCGHGRYAEWLIERGADVLAVDKSAKMLERARRRIGERAEIRRGDITKPLTFADDGEFDGVVCGLSLQRRRLAPALRGVRSHPQTG